MLKCMKNMNNSPFIFCWSKGEIKWKMKKQVQMIVNESWYIQKKYLYFNIMIKLAQGENYWIKSP